MSLTLAEILLVIGTLGTFGICLGVWTTLVVTLKHNRKHPLDKKHDDII